MQEIDLGKPDTTLTVLLYGEMKSGKTELAATFPRPWFLSDGTEGGEETLKYMNPAKFYESGVKPRAFAIRTYSDLIEGIQKIGQTVAKEPGQVLTGVVDSLTFISDGLQDAIMSREAAEVSKNKYYVWDRLKNYLRHAMIEAHKIPINWVWICLAKAPDGGNAGGPLLAGQMADKFPAACKLVLYQNCFQMNANAAPVFETRTKKYMGYAAGGRYGDRLPDPLVESSYRSIATALGIIPSGENQKKK